MAFLVCWFSSIFSWWCGVKDTHLLRSGFYCTPRKNHETEWWQNLLAIIDLLTHDLLRQVNYSYTCSSPSIVDDGSAKKDKQKKTYFSQKRAIHQHDPLRNSFSKIWKIWNKFFFKAPSSKTRISLTFCLIFYPAFFFLQCRLWRFPYGLVADCGAEKLTDNFLSEHCADVLLSASCFG